MIWVLEWEAKCRDHHLHGFLRISDGCRDRGRGEPCAVVFLVPKPNVKKLFEIEDTSR